MTCEKSSEWIPQVIRRELKSDLRIEALDHLRQCLKCRDEYLNQLKLFYSIDKALVFDAEKIDMSKIKLQIRNQLAGDVKSRRVFPGSYWFAAAILIIFIIILPWIRLNQEPKMATDFSTNNGITTALQDEDWIGLQKILNDHQEIKKRATEKIPLPLLIEKLRRLEKKGVHTITYADLIYQVNGLGENSATQSGFSSDKIQINTLLVTLQKYAEFETETTLQEISTYLGKIKKGGKDT